MEDSEQPSVTEKTVSEKRVRHRSYTVVEKLAVVAFAKLNSNSGASKEFKVDRKRVIEWRQMKSELQDSAENGGGKRRKLEVGGRKLGFCEMEEVLYAWIDSQRSAC